MKQSTSWASVAIAVIAPATAGLHLVSAQAPAVHDPNFCMDEIVSGLPRHQVIPGPGGSFGADLYVTYPLTQQVETVTASGVRSSFADLSSVISAGESGPWWPTFDRLGSYGFDLLVLEDVPGTDRVFRVSPAGTPVTLATTLGTDADALACDPNGVFGGELFLVEGLGEDALRRVTPGGLVETFATGVPDPTNGMAFSSGGALGAGLFLASSEDRLIYRIPAGHTPGAAATVFVDFGATGIQPVDIAISPGGAWGDDVMYIYDGGSESILKLDTAGVVLGTFASGFGQPLGSVAFGEQGDLAGALVVSNFLGGTLWSIHPSGQPAVESTRAGTPPNPVALMPGASSAPIIGATWDPWIDHSTFLPGAILDFMGITAGSLNVSLPPLGTLLCDPAITVAIVSAPAGLPFAVAVPDDCIFVGVSLCTQGASLDTPGVIRLTNALDISVGTF